MIKWSAAGLAILLLMFTVALGMASASPNQQDGQSLTVERSGDRMSATATWTPSQGGESQLFIYFGRLLLGEDDSYGIGLDLDNIGEFTLSRDDDSVAISDLDPRREYIYAVTWIDTDSDGNVIWGDWVTAGLVRQTSAETDREALVALYEATDGEDWRENDNWLSDAPVGEWQGVKTDEDGRVVELVLWADNLEGQLPPELGNLAKLERLNLFLNRLDGEIPPELGMLFNLKELILMGNQLAGAIPYQLGGLLKLEKLYFSTGNQFTGCIPSSLQNVAVNDLSELGLQFCS